METPLTHVVCPRCKALVAAEDAKSSGDPKMNLVLGYTLFCKSCQQESMLIYGGHPPLLDLDVNKVMIVWNMPEV